jgi:hypothetical protein
VQGKDLRDASGPWSGFYQQARQRGDMKLLLTIAEDRVLGAGDDIIGPFLINGTYERATEKVKFVKNYATHQVRYSGKWDGAVIHGRWTITNELFRTWGQFEIWPDDEALNLNMNEVEDVLKVGR